MKVLSVAKEELRTTKNGSRIPDEQFKQIKKTNNKVCIVMWKSQPSDLTEIYLETYVSSPMEWWTSTGYKGMRKFPRRARKWRFYC